MKDQANLVIIGAGIVGASAAYHLVQLGWRDILVVDQGPLFETGGSTSHAPGLVFQTNGSRMMCTLAQYTVELFNRLDSPERPVFYPVGGIEVAYTRERWQDLHRKHGWAQAYGLESHLLSPQEVQEHIPILDPSVIHGGYYVPSDGDANAVHAVEAMAEATLKEGAVEYQGHTRVTGFETQDGWVTAVVTDQGTIQAERVLLCTNIWGPVLADQLGVTLPLMSVEHQYLISEPLDPLQGETREIAHPILRHQDFSMYFRQHKDAYGIGSYKHDPLLVDPYQVGENAMRPFTERDFKLARTAARDLLPPLSGAEFPTHFNGMFAFTIDGSPILGPAPGWDNFWVAVGVWVTHAGGVGKAIAEWMDSGQPSTDLHEADINRFHEYATSKYYVRRTAAQQYREVYDVIHPKQQMEHTRQVRLAPYHPRLQALGGHFFESVGWERPQWYESNRRLMPRYRERIPQRQGWEAMYWSPLEGAEHLATREGVALFELSPFVKIEISGPGAAEYLDWLAANRVAGRVGRIVYTSLLTEQGHIMSDLTITRLAEDKFWALTGGGTGMIDLSWFRRHAPQDGSVHVADVSSQYTSVGLWGPKARQALQSVSQEDLSNQAFPYFTAKRITIESMPALALRISYVGELGWEIYVPSEFGLRLWDVLWGAGQEYDIIAAGMGAFDSLRLEKGYRSLGGDIHADYNPYEAGLGWAVRMDKGDFLGREALLKIKEQGMTRKLCCMTMGGGMALGKEPILDGERVLGYVTSANTGYSVGKHVIYGYLPSEYANKGTPVEIEYLGQRYPAHVDGDPLFDAKMSRLKA
jgi:glycine cleavage system aminomethyltransferase T/glycine/D-amino acid oxidase-like deaminating enzyme